MLILCNNVLFDAKSIRLLENTKTEEATILITGRDASETFSITVTNKNRDRQIDSIYHAIREVVVFYGNRHSPYLDISSEVRALNRRDSKSGFSNNLFTGVAKSRYDKPYDPQEKSYVKTPWFKLIQSDGGVLNMYFCEVGKNLYYTNASSRKGKDGVEVRFQLMLEGVNSPNNVDVSLTLSEGRYKQTAGRVGADGLVVEFTNALNKGVGNILGYGVSDLPLEQIIQGVSNNNGYVGRVVVGQASITPQTRVRPDRL